MAWDDLKASVAALIRTNGNQEITGALLRSTLNSIIDQVGANATFKGVATPSTVPRNPDGPVFYIASTQGTYANFGGFVLDGGFAVLSNVTGSWAGTKFLKTELDAKADRTELDAKADQTELDQLAGDVSVKMTNLLQNSSFENGVIEPIFKTDTGGAASALSINTINPISGNYDAGLKVIIPGEISNRPNVHLNGYQNKWVLNHIFYFGMSVKINSGTPKISFAHNGAGLNDLNLTLKDGFNSWTVECIGLNDFAVIYLDGRTLWNFNFDNLIAYDLTAIFGEGNEPTKEEMDVLISTIGTDYFEGEITIPAQKVMQWQLKLLNTAAEAVNEAAQGIDAKFAAKQDTLVSGENIKTVNGIDVLGNGNIVINPTIMDLKWTTNVATTRKLVPAELRKKGVKIAYRDASNVYHVEQYQAEAIDDASWENDANWKGCRTPMTPLFENAGATFNDETGFYELFPEEGGLTDIDENEAIEMYSYYTNVQTSTLQSRFFNCKLRSIFPIKSAANNLNISQMFQDCTNIEFIKLESSDDKVTVMQMGDMFINCRKLKKVTTELVQFNNVSNVNYGGTFSNCYLLECIKLTGILKDISFRMSPLLSYESVKHLIDNAKNTSAITVTVHETTYGYLTGTIEPTEQVGGTKEEWMQIVTDATEKQITFAT